MGFLRSGGCLAAFACAARAFVGAGVLFFCGLACAGLEVDLEIAFGAGLRAAVLLLDAAADFGGVALRGGALFAGFFAALFLLEACAVDLVALRAGAFSVRERLAMGLGRAAFPATIRFFAADVVVAVREEGRVGDLLTPLMTGSLMRSHRLSKGLLKKLQSRR